MSHASIDYDGLGKGVQLLFVGEHANLELVTETPWTISGGIGSGTSDKGDTITFTSPSALSQTGYSGMTGNVGTFFMFCPVVGAASTYGHALFSSSSPSVVSFQVDAGRICYILGVASNSPLPSWFNTTNRSLVCSSGGTAGTLKAYLDGVSSGVTWSSGPSSSWGSGDKILRLGGYVVGDSWDFNGSILVAGFTTEVWGATKAAAFHADPLSILLTEGGGTPGLGFVKVSGSWKNLSGVYVRVGGVWKSGQFHSRVSGSWKALS